MHLELECIAGIFAKRHSVGLISSPPSLTYNGLNGRTASRKRPAIVYLHLAVDKLLLSQKLFHIVLCL